MKTKKKLNESTFTLSKLEDYMYENESDIRDNMKTYGFTLKDISKIRNYMDFASILGIDSRLLKDVDLEVYTSYLDGFLNGDEMDESKQFKLASIAKTILKSR